MFKWVSLENLACFSTAFWLITSYFSTKFLQLFDPIGWKKQLLLVYNWGNITMFNYVGL